MCRRLFYELNLLKNVAFFSAFIQPSREAIVLRDHYSSFGLHCPGYTVLTALEDVGPSLIHSNHSTLCCPCAWPLQENCQRAIDLACTKVLSDAVIPMATQSSLQRGGFDWCVIGIPTWLPMWSVFNSLYSFTQKNYQMHFIWTSLIQE